MHVSRSVLVGCELAPSPYSNTVGALLAQSAREAVDAVVAIAGELAAARPCGSW
jgi:hypothetical protein